MHTKTFLTSLLAGQAALAAVIPLEQREANRGINPISGLPAPGSNIKPISGLPVPPPRYKNKHNRHGRVIYVREAEAEPEAADKKKGLRGHNQVLSNGQARPGVQAGDNPLSGLPATRPRPNGNRPKKGGNGGRPKKGGNGNRPNNGGNGGRPKKGGNGGRPGAGPNGGQPKNGGNGAHPKNNNPMQIRPLTTITVNGKPTVIPIAVPKYKPAFNPVPPKQGPPRPTPAPQAPSPPPPPPPPPPSPPPSRPGNADGFIQKQQKKVSPRDVKSPEIPGADIPLAYGEKPAKEDQLDVFDEGLVATENDEIAERGLET